MRAAACCFASGASAYRRPLRPSSRSGQTALGRSFRRPVTPRPSATGAAASGGGAGGDPTIIPIFLNSIPHSHEVREHFYHDSVQSVQRAVVAGELRQRVKLTIPELNSEFDVFRVGTFLEWTRELATALAQDGKQIKVCVQGGMGEGVFQGMPLALSGVRRLLEAMDWGDIANFVRFGEVGESEVSGDEAAYVILAPQNMVGGSIMGKLEAMVKAASARGRPVILLNPKLTDVQSPNGLMSYRGRAERIGFVDSFVPTYHFRLLYKGDGLHPIMGALRHVYGGHWQVYVRLRVGRQGERYELAKEFDDEPDAETITNCFRRPLSVDV